MLVAGCGFRAHQTGANVRLRCSLVGVLKFFDFCEFGFLIRKIQVIQLSI